MSTRVAYIDGAEYAQPFLAQALAGEVGWTTDPRDADVVLCSVFGRRQRSCTQPKVLVNGEPDDASDRTCDVIIDCKDEPALRPRGATFVYLPFYVQSFGERYRNVPQDLIKEESDTATTAPRTRFCAFMYSRDVPHRNAFFDALNEYKPVDALGRCRNADPARAEAAAADRRHYEPGVSTYNDLAVEKYRAYRFVICFENSSHPGYVTEKIVSAMLAGAVPIYFGAPDIAEHFDPRSFVLVRDATPSGYRAAIRRIKELEEDEDEYRRVASSPWLHGNRLGRHFDVAPLAGTLSAFFRQVRERKRNGPERASVRASPLQRPSRAQGWESFHTGSVRRRTGTRR